MQNIKQLKNVFIISAVSSFLAAISYSFLFSWFSSTARSSTAEGFSIMGVGTILVILWLIFAVIVMIINTVLVSIMEIRKSLKDQLVSIIISLLLYIILTYSFMKGLALI